MAALARLTWAGIKTEVLKRVGRENHAAAGSRVEQWIESVYRDLALTYHHYELDKVAADQAIASGATSLALPSDCYAVIGILLKSDAGVEIGRLTPQRANYLLGRRVTTPEQPEHYSRFGSSIYFAAPADQAYKVDVYYYSQPVAPDFASGSPAWDRLWDEYLIQGATDLAFRGYWDAENGRPHGESLAAFLTRVGNPQLATGILRDEKDSPTNDRPHGGSQG